MYNENGLSQLVDQMENLNFNGEMTRDAINMKVETLQELAPKMIEEMFNEKFENCTADVSIDFMDIDITILDEKGHWASEDFDEMAYSHKEELVALMEYMKEIG